MINEELLEMASSLKLLILDVDGVLTNGTFWYGPDGYEYKCFHIHDGYGIKQLLKTGVEVAIISGRECELVKRRMAELNIQHIYLGRDNKLEAFENLVQKLNIKADEVAYVGDDILDIVIMEKVGLPIAVHNAVQEVKKISTWQTKKSGGEGAVREVCDLILQARSQREQ